MSVLCWLWEIQREPAGSLSDQGASTCKLRMWDIRFGKCFLWSPEATISRRKNWLSGQNTVQREIGSIKSKETPWEECREIETNSHFCMFTLQKLSILTTYALALGGKILFFIKQVGHCQWDEIIPLYSKANQLNSRMFMGQVILIYLQNP